MITLTNNPTRTRLQAQLDDTKSRLEARNRWMTLAVGMLIFGTILFLFGVFIGVLVSTGGGWALGTLGFIFCIAGGVATAVLFAVFDEEEGGPALHVRRAQRALDDHDFEQER